MKKVQKITRIKLNLDQEADYILLGLVSSEPDYKLSLSLNKKFRISLKNISQLKVLEDDLTFSRFSNTTDPDSPVFTLVSNRSGKNFLINKLKNVDYLLQILVSEHEFDLSSLTSDLREVEAVTAVFNIDIKTIKDKNLHYLNQ